MAAPETRLKQNRKELVAIRASQRGFMIYLTSLNASELLPLCRGLRENESSKMLLKLEESQEAQQEDGFIDAIQLSDFAKAQLLRSNFEEEVETIEHDSYNEDKPFQRLINDTRVNKIAAYLREDDSLLPNSVILATRDEVEIEVEEAIPDNTIFKITLSWNDPLPINIIDGQHRIEALRQLIDDGYTEFNEFMIPFSLLIDLPFYMQAELFAIINGRQKAVNRSQIYDLLGYMPFSNQEVRDIAYQSELAVQRFCHKAVKVLNLSNASPWSSLIKMRGTGKGVVTQAAFVDHLAMLVTPRKNSKRLSTLPVLYPYFKKNDLLGMAKVCVTYFLGIKSAWPQYWENELSIKECLFGKTNGVAVMFMLLHDLVILLGGPEEVTKENVEKYWSKAPKERIDNPPAGGGKGYQKEWRNAIWREMIGGDSRIEDTNEFEIERKRLLMEKGIF
jgi:DGQHR domain-containing protein